jgi:hypothetical protein
VDGLRFLAMAIAFFIGAFVIIWLLDRLGRR